MLVAVALFFFFSPSISQAAHLSISEAAHLSISQAAHPNAVILTTTNPHSSQAHATTIKEFNVGHGQILWQLLDSQNLQPNNLSTDEDWRDLHGNVLTLQKDSI